MFISKVSTQDARFLMKDGAGGDALHSGNSEGGVYQSPQDAGLCWNLF